MLPMTTRIGINGPEISTATEAYAATIGVINISSLSSYRYPNPRAAFETEFHRRAGRIAELFAHGAWWNGHSDVATALWHRSAAFMTGHGSAGVIADPKIRTDIVASLTKRGIVANSDIAAKIPARFKMGESWPRYTYQSFTQEIFGGNTSGTYAYETPFAFRPVILRFFPKTRTIHSPDAKTHYCVEPKEIKECVDGELALLNAWTEADIPTARIIARDDNWYARERILGPSRTHLRVGFFYGLSQDAVDKANESWNSVPEALVRGGFMSSVEEAETFAQHNTAYNLLNGTWTVLRPTRIVQ